MGTPRRYAREICEPAVCPSDRRVPERYQMPRRDKAARVGLDAIWHRRPSVEVTRASVRTSTSCNLTPRVESRRFFFDRGWLVVDRLHEKLADLVRVVLGLAQAFVESVDDGAGVAPLQVIAHP